MISPIDDDYPHELRPPREEIIMSYSNNDHFTRKDDEFSSIISRLVDLQNEDSINYAYYNIKHDDAPLKWSEFFQGCKMKNFADSFNAFFENMKYFGMGFSDNHEKVIGFTKYGKQVNTQCLSSGEKQMMDESTLVIRLVNNLGRIEAYLSGVTFAEVNYLVFDIVSPEYHNQLYCQIQNRYNVSKVKACDDFISRHSSFDANKHHKASGYGQVQYNTICSYIRNAIDHFDNGNAFSEEELRSSILLTRYINS